MILHGKDTPGAIEPKNPAPLQTFFFLLSRGARSSSWISKFSGFRVTERISLAYSFLMQPRQPAPPWSKYHISLPVYRHRYPL